MVQMRVGVCIPDLNVHLCKHMKKLILLISLLSIFSCTDQKAIDAKAKHQAETGSRINNAQKDTDGLFDDMK